MLPRLDPPERAMVRRGRDCYARRIDWLSALPRTVIHGQFFGQNILLRRRSGAYQIAVIDWETAARGPGTFDLVSLTAGKWTKPQRHAMWAAYFEEYQATTGLRLEWAVFCRELATVALHQSLEWLTWWQRRRSLSRDFARFMNELSSVLEEHFAAG
jgi:aminoglycoside/choline kinase family phosphotransferase